PSQTGCGQDCQQERFRLSPWDVLPLAGFDPATTGRFSSGRRGAGKSLGLGTLILAAALCGASNGAWANDPRSSRPCLQQVFNQLSTNAWWQLSKTASFGYGGGDYAALRRLHQLGIIDLETLQKIESQDRSKDAPQKDPITHTLANGTAASLSYLDGQVVEIQIGKHTYQAQRPAHTRSNGTTTSLSYLDGQIVEIQIRKNTSQARPKTGPYRESGVPSDETLPSHPSILVQHSQHSGKHLESAQFLGDGPWILVRSSEWTIGQKKRGSIQVVDGKTNAVHWQLTDLVDSFTKIRASQDGTRVLVETQTGAIQIYDTATGKLLTVLRRKATPLKAMDISSDGSTVITISAAPWWRTAWQTLELWDAKTGKRLKKFSEPTEKTRDVRFSKDGKKLLIAADYGVFQIWNTEAGDALTVKGLVGQHNSTELSSDGTRVILSSSVGSSVFDAQTGQKVSTMVEPDDHYRPVLAHLSPDGSRALTTTSKQRLTLWDTQNGKSIMSVREKENDHLIAAAFAPNGVTFATGSEHGTVFLWDSKTGQGIDHFTGGKATVGEIAFSPDGRRLLATFLDGKVLTWDIPLSLQLQEKPPTVTRYRIANTVEQDHAAEQERAAVEEEKEKEAKEPRRMSR
ncbi:WD40 repeat domain-containing protein, partial [Bdellovibrionota bacterium FG-1]